MSERHYCNHAAIPEVIMHRIVSVLVLALSTATAFAADSDLALKREKIDPPAAVAEAVKAVLGTEAMVLRDRKDNVVLRLWLRAEIPARASAEQVKNGLTYHEIPATTVIGLIDFPNTFIDFRKQEIPAGVYTLRFAIQPETADHLGVTPHREFLLLTPSAVDRTMELTEPKTLIERSSRVTGGDHPAVMMLFPGNAKGTEAELADKGNGVKVLRFTSKLTAPGGEATLGFAITVSGHVKE